MPQPDVADRWSTSQPFQFSYECSERQSEHRAFVQFLCLVTSRLRHHGLHKAFAVGLRIPPHPEAWKELEFSVFSQGYQQHRLWLFSTLWLGRRMSSVNFPESNVLFDMPFGMLTMASRDPFSEAFRSLNAGPAVSLPWYGHGSVR